jgi:O-antigen ligase
MSNAHNGYLEVFLELGFAGLFFFTMFFLSSCWKAHKVLRYDFSWGSLWICNLLMCLLHNIAESSLNNFSSYLMASLLFLTVSSFGATFRKAVCVADKKP